MRVHRLNALLIFMLCFAAPSQANDSAAETALGGLQLVTSDSISLDKEELFISREEVRVDYLFTNMSDKDVETLVAFPLPDQSYGNEDEPVSDFGANLEFKTLVNGVAVPLQVVERALLKGADITARLSALGLDVHEGQDWESFQAKVSKIPSDALAQAVTAGLIEELPSDGEKFYQAKWSVSTAVTRTQVFPAGKTISVRHRYTPLVGGSVGGNLNLEYRGEDWSKEHAKQYCIGDTWFTAFDKALKERATENNPSPYSEWWIGYVLSSGANWKGPIKDFRLVIDKGEPEHLVSFCAEGVQRISATQFEVRKQNYEPKEDLKILIVDWIDPEEQEG